jgi:dTDP-4-amino-4,6-dideoxygalactose transaminase
MASAATARRVPFLDLAPVHQPLKAAVLEEFDQLLDSNAFINGPQVAEFEERWAAYCAKDHCVGTASGLDALRLALIAAGVGPGDEVIVPAHTFAASFEAVSQAGARPVPVDVSATDYNIDVDAVDAAVTERTSAIMPVHIYGQLCDPGPLRRLAERTGVQLIEDACQAHGARRDGVGAGGIGRAAAFSFYPGKNLGAMGDAGALVTDDADVATRVRALREHGQRAKYRHDFDGFTARLDTLQALMLVQKLPHLDAWNEQRRWIAERYAVALEGIGDLTLPPTPDGSRPVWHLYVVRTRSPERLASFLEERGIGTGRHYPEPPHLSRAYESLGRGPGSFPVAEAIARECLSLPIYPGMPDESVEGVCAAIVEYFDRA